MKYFNSIVICILCICAQTLTAQIFKTNVKVNAPNIQNADPKSLERLEAQISEFYNNESFVDIEFEDHEKIEFNVTVFIKDQSLGERITSDRHSSSCRMYQQVSRQEMETGTSQLRSTPGVGSSSSMMSSTLRRERCVRHRMIITDKD